MAYDVVAGDGGSKISVTIIDSLTAEPIDLTGKTIKLRYSHNGGATVEKTMTMLNQTSNKGQAEYAWLVADFTVGGTLIGGTLNGEVRLQAGLSDQLTTVDNFYMAVKVPLP